MRVEFDPKVYGSDLEYVVHHYHPRLSYYNYYDNKFKAFLEAINPRFWKCTTTVYAYHRPVKPQPMRFESYT